MVLNDNPAKQLYYCLNQDKNNPAALAAHIFAPFISCGYTPLGFGDFWRVNGLRLVQLRFHVTHGDAVTQ